MIQCMALQSGKECAGFNSCNVDSDNSIDDSSDSVF